MPDWEKIRHEFPLERSGINLAAMVMASTPHKVTRAINTHREALDLRPQSHAAANNSDMQEAVFAAVADYFGVPKGDIADTHSTTCALAQLYCGIRVAPGYEVLTSSNEHFTTTDTLRILERRDGTPFRRVALFRDSAAVTANEIVWNVNAAIKPSTRVLALTWVYSSDGVKLPIRQIAAVVESENRRRGSGTDPLVFVVDGVHGFGVENDTFANLKCDFFASGCHKWIFGPRGTAIICGRPQAWAQLSPWIVSQGDTSIGPGRGFIPGGVRVYEHWWAIKDAIDFLTSIGKKNIQDRVWQLATRLKKGLSLIDGVDVRTPLSTELSSGVVCFDVKGFSAGTVVDRLLSDHSIHATESGWDATAGRTHARFSPSILNSEAEIDTSLRAVEALVTGDTTSA
jgi:selenocysteine lyase/cysteine desulfurase